MGRKAAWLAAQRPAMVTILKEMERNSPYTAGEGSHGDLTLMLTCLARVVSAPGGAKPSIAAMRQAWWRWTTDKSEAATPAVRELAEIVRYARVNGWLHQLTDPAALALVARLKTELENMPAAQRRKSEKSWTPTARTASEQLVDFLERRLEKRSAEEGEGGVGGQPGFACWGPGLPPAVVVQEEARIMVSTLLRQVVLGLREPRDAIPYARDADTLIQPFEGWPEVLRDLAITASAVLTDAAAEQEEYEEELAASYSGPPSTNLKRIKLFGVTQEEPPVEDA